MSITIQCDYESCNVRQNAQIRRVQQKKKSQKCPLNIYEGAGQVERLAVKRKVMNQDDVKEKPCVMQEVYFPKQTF